MSLVQTTRSQHPAEKLVGTVPQSAQTAREIEYVVRYNKQHAWLRYDPHGDAEGTNEYIIELVNRDTAVVKRVSGRAVCPIEIPAVIRDDLQDRAIELPGDPGVTWSVDIPDGAGCVEVWESLWGEEDE